VGSNGKARHRDTAALERAAINLPLCAGVDRGCWSEIHLQRTGLLRIGGGCGGGLIGVDCDSLICWCDPTVEAFEGDSVRSNRKTLLRATAALRCSAINLPLCAGVDRGCWFEIHLQRTGLLRIGGGCGGGLIGSDCD
jgi:hypothetical protein